MPPPARPVGHSAAPQPAAQVGDQKPQDGVSAPNPAGLSPGGPIASELASVIPDSLPAQIARPVIRSVVETLGKVFRLDSAELRKVLDGITD